MCLVDTRTRKLLTHEKVSIFIVFIVMSSVSCEIIEILRFFVSCETIEILVSTLYNETNMLYNGYHMYVYLHLCTFVLP